MVPHPPDVFLIVPVCLQRPCTERAASKKKASLGLLGSRRSGLSGRLHGALVVRLGITQVAHELGVALTHAREREETRSSAAQIAGAPAAKQPQRDGAAAACVTQRDEAAPAAARSSNSSRDRSDEREWARAQHKQQHRRTHVSSPLEE